MATIRKGKNKGKEVKIHQWCNDWFIVDDGVVVSPTNIILNAKEMFNVITHKNNGIMGQLFELKGDGTFKRR